MSQSERQLWAERIARALAELQSEPLTERNPQTDARQSQREPTQKE